MAQGSYLAREGAILNLLIPLLYLKPRKMHAHKPENNLTEVRKKIPCTVFFFFFKVDKITLV